MGNEDRINTNYKKLQKTTKTIQDISLLCLFSDLYSVFIWHAGQFFHKGVVVDEARRILIMPDKEPVPVIRRPVWSFMERETPDDQLCGTAMNPGYQGEGLIDGKHSDYIVESILSPKFTFTHKSN